jgi:hypothetical protein
MSGGDHLTHRVPVQREHLRRHRRAARHLEGMAGEEAHGAGELARPELGYDGFALAGGGLDHVDASFEHHKQVLERLARSSKDLPGLGIALLAEGEQEV